MRQFLSILLAFSFLSPSLVAEDTESADVYPAVALSAPASPAPNVLPGGTPVKLRLTRDLSSAKVTPGERVDFEVEEEVQVNGLVVIATGAMASATVTKAHGKQRMARAGVIELKLNSVRLLDDDTAAITATAGGKGNNRIGEMVGAMTAFSVVSLGGAGLFLLVRGNDVTIPQGTEITAYVDGNLPLDLTKLTPLQAAVRQSPTRRIPATELTLTSLPDGADIELDGAHLGITSLMVRINAGDHTVRIRKNGYETFEKKLHADGGSIGVNAELTKATREILTPIPISPTLR